MKASELTLFDDNNYANLKSISEVLDRVCMCKKDSKDDQPVTHRIECNYGTYKNCKFVIGKPYFCILNPEGQLRRKRDVRRMESMFSRSQNERILDLAVSFFYMFCIFKSNKNFLFQGHLIHLRDLLQLVFFSRHPS